MDSVSNEELINSYLKNMAVTSYLKNKLKRTLNYYLEKANYSLEEKIEVVSKVVENVDWIKSKYEDTFQKEPIYLSSDNKKIRGTIRKHAESPKEINIFQLDSEYMFEKEKKLQRNLRKVFRQLYENTQLREINFDDLIFETTENLEDKLKEIKNEFWFYTRLVIPKTKIKNISFNPLKIEYFYVETNNRTRKSLKEQISIINRYYETKNMSAVSREKNVSIGTVKRTLIKHGVPNYTEIKKEIISDLVTEGLNSNEISKIVGITPETVRKFAKRNSLVLKRPPVHNKYISKDFKKIIRLFEEYDGDINSASKNTKYARRIIRGTWIKAGLITGEKDYSKVDFKNIYIKNKGNKSRIMRELNCDFTTVKKYCDKIHNLPTFPKFAMTDEQENEFKILYNKYVGKPMIASNHSDYTNTQISIAWRKLGLKVYPAPLKEPMAEYYENNLKTSLTQLGKMFGCSKATAKRLMIDVGFYFPNERKDYSDVDFQKLSTKYAGSKKLIAKHVGCSMDTVYRHLRK